MAASRKTGQSGAARRRAALEARARRRRRWRVAAGVAGVTVMVGVAVIALVAGGDRDGEGDGPPATEVPEVATSFEAQTTPPPWPASYVNLADRIEKLGFPPVGDESYHVHALLSVFVDGEQVTVPANIGIDQASGTVSPLHTHDPNGIVHLEADEPYPFSLVQVLGVWGVAFGPGQLGGMRDEGPKSVQVYVNGEQIIDPVAYELRDQDNIVIAYGEPGSFPIEPPADALSGA